MEHVYEKVRDSTEGSSSLDSSEELGFISEQAKIKHKSSNSIRQRLSGMSARAMVEALMGGLIFVLLIIIASYHSARTKHSKSDRLPRFGPACKFFHADGDMLVNYKLTETSTQYQRKS
jgi:hypothetical protein